MRRNRLRSNYPRVATDRRFNASQFETFRLLRLIIVRGRLMRTIDR